MLLEIKTDGAMPLWLSHALDKLGILPVSFSKYGTAYRQTLQQRISIADVPAIPAQETRGDLTCHV